MCFRPAELRKGSWALETLPLSLTPSPHHSLGKLDSGVPEGTRRVKHEHWGHGEIGNQSSPGPGSGLQCRCWLTWCHVKGGKDRWATQKACCLPWAGPLPTPSASRRVFCLCFLGVSLFDHFSETKVLHLTYDQVIVRFLSLLPMTMLQWFMILRSSGIKKVRFIHSPILKTHTWNIPFKKIEATERKWNHIIKYCQFPIWSPQKPKPGKFFQ